MWIFPVAFAVVVMLLPTLGLSAYWQRQAVQMAIYFLLASSLNLVLGYAGEFALGQVAIMASGAYVTAILFNHGHRELLLAMALAVFAGLVISLATGIPSIRLSSWTLGLVSFFLVLLIPGVVSIFDSETGGLNGISGLFDPTFFGIHLDGPERYYLMSFVVTFAWLFAMRNLVRSRFGTALQNMREGPLLSTSLGVSTLGLRLGAYLISSVPAALAGCIYTYTAGIVSPEGFSLDVVVAIIAAAVVGGLGSLYGAMIGAFLLVIGPLRAASFKEYSLIIYGGFLVFVAVLFPSGVAGALKQLRDRVVRRFAAPPQTEAEGPPAARPALAIPGERLEIEGVSKRFGGLRALDDVTMVAEPGRVTALIGPNGAGKTTLLNTVSGFTPTDGGTISIGDRTVSGLRAERVARSGVGRTFQTPMIPRSMTVVEVVESGRLSRGRIGLLASVLRLPSFRRTRVVDRAMAQEALRFAHLDRVAGEDAQALPLGTRRLLEVVRAVVAEPHVVLLDEPAAGLDDDGLRELGTLVRHMRDAGATVVLVEHNVPFVLDVADTVYVLEFGAVIASGPPHAVRTDPKVIASYLGGRAAVGVDIEPEPELIVNRGEV
jgi:branched-chain amino acid transport system permease protein